MALIELRSVSKIYHLGGEEIRALDSVDLDIEGGEFISIIGPSGSGKSTLMHILGCLDSPTHGSITTRRHRDRHRFDARTGAHPESEDRVRVSVLQSAARS